ncbi:MAG TPA: zinc-dependent alcohol dehydrogenase family protein, partial [Candidatus Limnocylindrales bacterium]|nr:zinc-dependent alcohol dehydrogenase family protein [Candidatus Limnocylindrales bacterium]
MRAVLYAEFREPPVVREVEDPACPGDGVVVRVEATGLCRSDWHGWQGHDPDIRVPHVPGHELAGVIAEVGPDVQRWRVGERVTVPFVCACGVCGPCLAGDHQVCDNQFQPGFTHWGSFAELVALHRADINLVPLPDEVDFVTAASLGCRFATAHRAVVGQGRVGAGEWVAVHGCGGVGLSAVMIAVAAGARVVAIDVSDAALEAAIALGAMATVDGAAADVVPRVIEATEGGANLSIDALGSAETAFNSIASLAKRGRHVQVGLMVGGDARAPVPMDLVVARELEILGSHGMAAHDYDTMLASIA